MYNKPLPNRTKGFTMYHDTLNQALNSEKLEMDMLDVSNKIGTISYGETVRFQHDNKQVVIYRSDVTGRYEITAYKL